MQYEVIKSVRGGWSVWDGDKMLCDCGNIATAEATARQIADALNNAVSLPNQSSAEDTQLMNADAQALLATQTPEEIADFIYYFVIHNERQRYTARIAELERMADQLTTDLTAAWANGNTLRAELERVKRENREMRDALIRWHQSNETDGFIGADEALAKLAAELAGANDE